MKITTKLWIGILLLALLSPLGLILPRYFKTSNTLSESPKPSALWQAPITDYAFKGSQEKGLPRLSFDYVISAIVGIAIIFIVVLLIGKKLTKKGD